ncbi:MAG: cupredoxin domain-containing protein [Thermomicrobia bacterium]|nr:cupredoxin domain-containing protein [Thermomicrobia bacterium]MCA1724197.1 cupredoxin domain-containing protein [Thermomicrobia bacterium]
MRSATTKRSVGGLVAFVVGLGVTTVLVVGSLVVGSGGPAPFVTAVPVGGSAAAGGSAVAGGSDQPAPAAADAINFIEKEFSIAMDKSTIKAGSITFNVKNNGATPHTLGVTKESDSSKGAGITGPVIKESGTIDSGKTATLAVDLQPGTYNIVCTIPGHAQLGMIMTLTVQ